MTCQENVAPKGRVFVGTQVSANEPGVHSVEVDLANGSLRLISSVKGVARPAFLAVAPGGKRVFAVSEASGQGQVASLSVADDGSMSLVKMVPSGGAGPCHLSVDRAGRRVLVAHYGDGSLASLMDQANGEFSEAHVVKTTGKSVDPKRQTGPHAHAIILSPEESFAIATDLGADVLRIFDVDPENGALKASQVASVETNPGSGPRHLAWHPAGTHLYVANELDNSVTTFRLVERRLEKLGTVSTLPPEHSGQSYVASIVVHPSGRFVYVSNRKADLITVLDVDPAEKTLKPKSHVSSGGSIPWDLELVGEGRFLLVANRDSNNLLSLRIGDDGVPTPTGASVSIAKPCCVESAPSDR